MTEMEIVCELESNAKREAQAAGDPYGPMEGMAMSTRFSLMARKHTVHVITVHSLADIKALKFPSDGFYDIRLVMAHCHEHPDAEAVVLVQGSTTHIVYLELHASLRGYGFTHVVASALPGLTLH